MRKIPNFSKNSCHSVYSIGDGLLIDNIAGLGATKSHSTLKGRGFHNRCSPGTFIKLCETPVQQQAIDRVEAHLDAGLGVACPQLYIDIEGYVSKSGDLCRIVGFDGLDRVGCFARRGIVCLYVQVVPVGYRLAGLDCLNEFFNWLSRGIRVAHKIIPFPIDKVV